MDDTRIIEAALFMGSRPIPINEIAKLIGVGAMGYARERMRALQKEYDERKSAIAIVEEDGKYLMRLRPEYIKVVRDFAQEAEIPRHALKTLAYIYKYDGMLKSQLARKLGGEIYSDVKELVQKGFLSQEKKGRTSVLRITKKFKDYFGE
jgi:segregation and condensation protein B